MSETSRRRFLAVTGTGAAAVGAATVVPGAAFAGETPRSENSADEAVVAYVKDARSGELVLMVGEREVVVDDRDLVNRLLNAAGR
jgi:hypothetical protein